MDRYDRGWTRGYGRGYGQRGPGGPGGYDAGFGWWADGWGSAPEPGFWGRGVGLYRQWGTPWEAGGPGGYGRRYDRGLYGRDYPGFRGRAYAAYPDLSEYGHGRGPEPRRPGFSGGWQGERGFDRGGFDREGYDGGFGDRGPGRGTFVPDEAYRRHPELDRPQRHLGDRWPSGGHDLSEDLSDDEIRRAVRQNLYNDNWIDPERIEVEVSEQVVMLRGDVDDYLEARYAWDDAWEAAGVRGVVNQLTVRTDQPAEEHGDVVPQTSGGRKKSAGTGGGDAAAGG